ncbi:DUF2334 domain-containing protein [Thiococcus pfennigii]|uniref:DUF2334 domain-containing protein n=1 Tax=Thiococcus pfennigii TaxID=1057 RepID=UPI001F5B7E62|nr:polysaccharide deacetylase family protein [Thiococcus pfennigii]
MPTRALVSVHDLMPETLPAVLEILAFLERHGCPPATLLVVPGGAWSPEQLATLKALARAGHPLAGHGWHHRIARLGGAAHWLHSRLISRNVAEHLALDEDGIVDLIGRCFDWFADQGFAAPTLYVPPAWAMGRIARARLAALPFRYYEVLSGVYDTDEGRLRRLPLLGYEADTGLRAAFLRFSNGASRALAGRRPIRIAIHPFDLGLRLADDLARDLHRYTPTGWPEPHAAPA